VTEPIDAGFFLYRVPDEHRVHAARPVSVTLLDDLGKVLLGEPVVDVADYASRGVIRRLRSRPPLLVEVPANVQWAERRQLFDWRLGGHARIGLWIAPVRGGGTCMWADEGGTLVEGCTPAGEPAGKQMARLGLGGQAHVSLCCVVGRAVIPGYPRRFPPVPISLVSAVPPAQRDQREPVGTVPRNHFRYHAASR
jgi:hypothetical protein